MRRPRANQNPGLLPREVDMEAHRKLDRGWRLAILVVLVLALMSLPALLTVTAMSGSVAGPDWTDHIWPLLFVPALWAMFIAAVFMAAVVIALALSYVLGSSLFERGREAWNDGV